MCAKKTAVSGGVATGWLVHPLTIALRWRQWQLASQCWLWRHAGYRLVGRQIDALLTSVAADHHAMSGHTEQLPAAGAELARLQHDFHAVLAHDGKVAMAALAIAQYAHHFQWRRGGQRGDIGHAAKP